jgi:hypothetical protein
LFLRPASIEKHRFYSACGFLKIKSTFIWYLKLKLIGVANHKVPHLAIPGKARSGQSATFVWLVLACVTCHFASAKNSSEQDLEQ